MEFAYDLKIPKERIAVLIGKEGNTKAEIESATNSRINIDSKEGEVRITGEDSLGLFTAKEVIKAIARGFNPEVAKLLLKPDYSFVMINIQDFAGSKNSMQRLKGRVIGKEGKSRKVIEDLTETYIAVYGKTISVVGEIKNVQLAIGAIESLLEGNTHASVYKWLEKKRRELVKEVQG